MDTTIKNAEHMQSHAVYLKVPELFADKDFQQYLNTTTIASWHRPGAEFHEDDWNDTVIFLESSLNGEGSNSDMPYHDLIVEKVKELFPFGIRHESHIVVILRS